MAHACRFLVGFNYYTSPSRRFKQEKHVEKLEGTTLERTCENFKSPILKLKDVMIMCSYVNPSSEMSHANTLSLILRELELPPVSVLLVYCEIITSVLKHDICKWITLFLTL